MTHPSTSLKDVKRDYLAAELPDVSLLLRALVVVCSQLFPIQSILFLIFLPLHSTPHRKVSHLRHGILNKNVEEARRVQPLP